MIKLSEESVDRFPINRDWLLYCDLTHRASSLGSIASVANWHEGLSRNLRSFDRIPQNYSSERSSSIELSKGCDRRSRRKGYCRQVGLAKSTPSATFPLFLASRQNPAVSRQRLYLLRPAHSASRTRRTSLCAASFVQP